MVRESRDVAAALNNAPGFLVGISEDRRKGLVHEAVLEFAPDDAHAMVHAVEVGAEADKLEQGLRKLKAAAYDTAQSNKARDTFVDAEAPFAAPPAEAAEWRPFLLFWIAIVIASFSIFLFNAIGVFDGYPQKSLNGIFQVVDR